MSYNPNGPRNNLGTTYGTTGSTGMTGTTGTTSSTTGYGTTSGDLGGSLGRNIPVTEAEETPETLRARAEHLASQMKDKASQLGSTVSEKANAAVTTVGEKMTDVAGVIREKAPTSMSEYADKTANTLERAGMYLQQHDLGEFFDDVSGIIRRHPVPAMLTGVAIGFLLARNSRR